MFRQSVESFRTELHRREPEDHVAEVLTAMRREMVAVRALVSSLERDLVSAVAELDRERDALASCERRGDMARAIGDEETVRIAAEFAERHRNKVRILDQKRLALVEELELRRREVRGYDREVPRGGREPFRPAGSAPAGIRAGCTVESADG